MVPLPIRFTARKDGDLRSDRVLGEDAGTIIFVSVRAQPHDQDGGDLRSGRVLGQETGTIIFVSRPGKMETFGQIACSTGADGDLRSGRVLGQETGTIIFVSVRAQPLVRSGTGGLGWVPPPL